MKNKEHYIYQEFKPYLDSCGPSEKIYIEKRLINQIIWYDKKAEKKQRYYKLFTIFSILFTSAVPLIGLLTRCENSINVSLLSSLFCTISNIFISISNLCEYHKLWIEYRTTCEMLKSILYRYFMRSNEFNSLDEKQNLNLLISLCEEYMTKEFQAWTKLPHECKKEQ